MNPVVTVDVVILTWNDGALLDEAVMSALRSEGVSVRVVVVDNGSEPPATTVDDPRVCVLRNETNLGVAAGRNLGVRHGRAPLVCLLDSDAVLEPASLATLAAAVDGGQHIAVAGPVFAGQAPTDSGGRAPSLRTKLARAANLRADYDATPDDGDAWDVDFVIGACQLVRRNAFEAVGGLDERFFYGPEDVDFCLRLREAGWRVVQVRDVSVHHPARRRNRRLFTRRGLAHAWAVTRFLWRHRGSRRRAGTNVR